MSDAQPDQICEACLHSHSLQWQRAHMHDRSSTCRAKQVCIQDKAESRSCLQVPSLPSPVLEIRPCASSRRCIDFCWLNVRTSSTPCRRRLLHMVPNVWAAVASKPCTPLHGNGHNQPASPCKTPALTMSASSVVKKHIDIQRDLCTPMNPTLDRGS